MYKVKALCKLEVGPTLMLIFQVSKTNIASPQTQTPPLSRSHLLERHRLASRQFSMRHLLFHFYLHIRHISTPNVPWGGFMFFMSARRIHVPYVREAAPHHLCSSRNLYPSCHMRQILVRLRSLLFLLPQVKARLRTLGRGWIWFFKIYSLLNFYYDNSDECLR